MTDPVAIADQPKSGEDIASDLAMLMERLERARKSLSAEREYIKLILMGFWFVLFGAVSTPGFPWQLIFAIGLLATPWLLGWYNLPRLRLSNAFLSETLPFLLRDYGRWNYALSGTHFSRQVFRKLGFIRADDEVNVHSIITGERYGVPLQIAVVETWPHPRFGFYRGHKPSFTGWTASIRLAELPSERVLILPNGRRPRDPSAAGWQVAPLSHSHQLWQPSGSAVILPQTLQARLIQIMVANPQALFAIAEGNLWVIMPDDGKRFQIATSFNVPLNEQAPYTQARGQLAEIFKVVDMVVWPG